MQPVRSRESILGSEVAKVVGSVLSANIGFINCCFVNLKEFLFLLIKHVLIKTNQPYDLMFLAYTMSGTKRSIDFYLLYVIRVPS